MTDNERIPLRYRKVWALTNLGNPVSIHSTRQQAIAAAEAMRDDIPWSILKTYMEVRKVTLNEGWT